MSHLLCKATKHPLSSNWSRHQLISHLLWWRQLQLHQLTVEGSQILNKLQFGLVIVCLFTLLSPFCISLVSSLMVRSKNCVYSPHKAAGALFITDLSLTLRSPRSKWNWYLLYVSPWCPASLSGLKTVCILLIRQRALYLSQSCTHTLLSQV